MAKFDPMTRVAINVKNILEARGWSQKDLADALGVDESNFSKTLNGKHSPRLDFIQRIADVLKVDISEVFAPLEHAYR
jgi:transcriptional regulator with XRE-family HTH domain